MKPIVHIPNPVLTSPSKTVTRFDKKLHELIHEMEKTLLATQKPKGVGLAASQVGEPYRIFITKPTPKAEIRAFINPEILAASEVHIQTKEEKEHQKLEGCLSIPEIWGEVTRAPSVTLRYQDLQGETHEDVIDGFLATIIQHETDHTNGILFTQRVIEQHGKLYKNAQDKDGKEILEEIQI